MSSQPNVGPQPAPVTVTNVPLPVTAAQPLPITAANPLPVVGQVLVREARPEPFHHVFAGAGVFVVPQGRTAVIEFVSASDFGQAPQQSVNPFAFNLLVSVSGIRSGATFASDVTTFATPTVGQIRVQLLHQQIKMYADGGTNVEIQAIAGLSMPTGIYIAGQLLG